MYYVYILNNTKQFYVGSTNNLKRRLFEHQKPNKARPMPTHGVYPDQPSN